MQVSLGELQGKACGSVRFEVARVDGVNEVLYDTPKCYVFSANDIFTFIASRKKIVGSGV